MPKLPKMPKVKSRNRGEAIILTVIVTFVLGGLLAVAGLFYTPEMLPAERTMAPAGMDIYIPGK